MCSFAITMPAYIELHMQAYVLAIVKYLNMFSALFIFQHPRKFCKMCELILCK